MENKHVFLIWALLLVLIVAGVTWLILEPVINWTHFSEARLYARLFLAMFAVNTFATLRLYNSIVQNTRFSIRLRESVVKFSALIPGIERALRNLSNSLGAAKASMDALKKEVSDGTDEVSKFTDKLRKLKS